MSSAEVLALGPVLRRLCDYTLVIDDYLAGRLESQCLGILADERNFVQHSVMSLAPSDEDLLQKSPENPLYDLCRLAATVYSLIVVCPIPLRTAPFATLACQMQLQMTKVPLHEIWSIAPHLLLWITTMAAISSLTSDPNQRSYFVSILQQLVGFLRMHSWLEMKDVLQNFLWLDSISDSDGLELWQEIER